MSSRDPACILVEEEIRTSHFSKWVQTLACQLARSPTSNPKKNGETSDNVEDTLKPAAEKLEGELAERLRVLSPPEDSKARAEYDNAIAELLRTVNEKYRQLLDRKRQEVDKKGS